MDRKQFERFRKALAASGVPLEFEVAKVLTDLGAEDLKEDFSFRRKTEGGEEKDFSVDLGATFYLGEGKRLSPRTGTEIHLRLHWQTLVECKYCREGVAWVFLPSLRGESASQPHRCYTVVEDFVSEPVFRERRSGPRGSFLESLLGYRQAAIRRREVEDATSGVPECTKGFEVREESPNAQPVREASSQLQFAHVAQIAEDLPLTLDEFFNPSRTSDLFVYSRFIVTTATLFVLKPSISLEQINSAASLVDLVDEKDVIELKGPYSPELHTYQRQVLERFGGFGDRFEDVTTRRRKQFEAHLRRFVNRIALQTPSVFVVRFPVLRNHLSAQIKSLQGLAKQKLEHGAGPQPELPLER